MPLLWLAFIRPAMASDIPMTATEVVHWVRDGGVAIAVVVFFLKWLWSDWKHKSEKEEKHGEQVIDDIKKTIKKLHDSNDEIERSFQTLLSTVTKLQVTYEKHAENVIERRRAIDVQIKEIQDIMNQLMVTKAKEIAEFDTKINEHSRRIDKIETRCDRAHSVGLPK